MSNNNAEIEISWRYFMLSVGVSLSERFSQGKILDFMINDYFYKYYLYLQLLEYTGKYDIIVVGI